MKDELKRWLESVDPEAAVLAMAETVRELFSVVGEESRVRFFLKLVEAPKDDKVASMVHL